MLRSSVGGAGRISSGKSGRRNFFTLIREEYNITNGLALAAEKKGKQERLKF
jgi:hypothetical protein